MKKTLIIGATSAIAQATARLFAEAENTLFLVARNADRLAAVAEDLRLRGASSVHTATLDVIDYDRHKDVVDTAIATLGGIDLVIIAHGSLPNQKACEQSFQLTRENLEVNTLGTISLLTYLANYFEKRQQGMIAVISSVAGDRGRQSNYVYGTSKGALTLFLQGLRNRLHKSGVKVLAIKPGFIDTPMTKAFSKGLLWVKPEIAAKYVVRAIKREKDIAYAPPFWAPIMLVIKSIPESLFKRLQL